MLVHSMDWQQILILVAQVALVALGLKSFWAGVLFWRNKLPPRIYARLQGTLLIVLGVANGFIGLGVVFLGHKDTQYSYSLPSLGDKLPDVPEIVKKDCQKLVDGQLLFEP